MYIRQKQLDYLLENIKKNKVFVVYGPRRCGKTTLIQHFIEEYKQPVLLTTGEDITDRQSLSSQSIEQLKQFIGKYKLLVIDEAQKVPEIGLNLKLIVDHITDITVIATGSASFDLANQVGEPLTGRKYTVRLFPLAQLELQSVEQGAQTAARLEQRLLYGSYPEVVTMDGSEEREAYLRELTNAYLYKDILEVEGLRHSDKLLRLLQLLAFQIGSEVSLSELGRQLEMSKQTVGRYMDLLEKTFVIFHVGGLSRNLRTEVSKSSRYYFYDVGVRNALIENFNPLAVRNDVGMLWENYCVVERIKRQEYIGPRSRNFFWRTYAQQEIDWVEEYGGRLHGYEMKWSPQKVSKIPNTWRTAYPNASYTVINPTSYRSFIGAE